MERSFKPVANARFRALHICIPFAPDDGVRRCLIPPAFPIGFALFAAGLVHVALRAVPFFLVPLGAVPLGRSRNDARRPRLLQALLRRYRAARPAEALPARLVTGALRGAGRVRPGKGRDPAHPVSGGCHVPGFPAGTDFPRSRLPVQALTCRQLAYHTGMLYGYFPGGQYDKNK